MKHVPPIAIGYLRDGYASDTKEFWAPENVFSIRGTADGFCLYRNGRHPSDFFFRLTISNPSKYSDSEIKKHYKAWKSGEQACGLMYDGVVEYYVTDVYPTIKDLIIGVENRELSIIPMFDGAYDKKPQSVKEIYGGVAVKRTSTEPICVIPYTPNTNYRAYLFKIDDILFSLIISKDFKGFIL